MKLNSKKIGTYTISIVCAFVMFMSVNILASLFLKNVRIDLTEDKLFTLTKSTYDVVDSIEDDIIIRLYFSSDLGRRAADLNSYYKRVSELVEFYSSISKGKIKLEFINPKPFSTEEESAVQSGLLAIPLGDFNTQGFFGLVVSNYEGDKKSIISFFDASRENLLEYDITKAIHSVVQEKRKKIGVLSYLPIMGKKPMSAIIKRNVINKWAFAKRLEKDFDLVEISKVVDSIPSNLDGLVVLYPNHMDAKTVYAIDQFVLKGGNLLMFVDPFSEIEAKRKGVRLGGTPNLDKLFAAWRVSFDAEKVVSDIDLGMNIGSVNSDAKKGKRNLLTKNPLWIRMGEKELNSEHPVTRGLENIAMASAGAFKLNPKQGVIFTPLIHSSENSTLADVKHLEIGISHETFLRNFVSDNEQKVLAVKLSGTPSSMYKVPPKSIVGLQRHVLSAKKSINVILIADSDMVYDGLSVRRESIFGSTYEVPMTENLEFTINAIDYLTGNDALIDLRGRGVVKRPLDVLQGLKNEIDRSIRVEEQVVLERLSKNQYRLAALLIKSAKNKSGVSEDEIKEMVQLDKDIKADRGIMAKMQYQSRLSIEKLYNAIGLINVFTSSVLVLIFAVFFAIARYRRRNKYYKELENGQGK
ncbi:MAG: GldG family protein [Alphaproteobacteria bacterium]|nr:GldG family protein [Alphaproteobacteria bacterium]